MMLRKRVFLLIALSLVSLTAGVSVAQDVNAASSSDAGVPRDNVVAEPQPVPQADLHPLAPPVSEPVQSPPVGAPSATLAPPTPRVIVSEGPSRVAPSGAEPGYRELRVTPTTKGGPGDPASVAAGPGGFTLTSNNNRWQISFRALIQADGRFWFDDTERPQINTFLIRRAQPYIEGRLPYGVSFLISPDFGGGTAILQDAYLGLDLLDALKFRIGKFRPPFGLERLQPTSNLSFVEFGLPTLLTPNRDVGAMVHGDLFSGFFGYAGGIFNGVPDNGSADLDADSQKEFAGRVYFRPLRALGTEALGRLFIGVATTFGRVSGNPTNTALPNPALTPAYKTPGQISDFTYISAASGVTPSYSNTVVANGAHNRYGAYLYEAVGPFSLLGEYYISNQVVGRAGFGSIEVRNHAYQAQATFILFGADAAYDYVHVRTPVEPSAGHFGALEIAARIGHLAVDSDVFPNFASPTGSIRGATEGTFGANWYWSDNAKFVINWDHTAFQGGAKTPTEVAAGHREDENIFLLRAQVVY